MSWYFKKENVLAINKQYGFEYIQIKKIIDANMDYIAQICLL